MGIHITIIQPKHPHSKVTGAIIENNTINVYGPSIEAITNGNQQLANTLAIELLNSKNVKINNNTITIINTTEQEEDSLINAITTINSENLTITNNTINITGVNTLTPINNTNQTGTYIEEDNTIIKTEPEEDDSQWNKVIVTPENINQYVNFNYETSGHLNFEPFTKAIFVGTFSNYGLDFLNNNIIIDGSNATFTDVVFSITRKSNITIQNAKMNSSPNTIGSLITSSERSTNITIKNNTLYLYNTESIDTTYAQWGLISPFYSHGIFLFNNNDSIIENNTIYIYGPSVDQNSNQPNTYAIELTMSSG